MRQTGIFQETGRYDQDTLDRIAALMEQENQGRLRNSTMFRTEINDNRGEYFFGRLKWESEQTWLTELLQSKTNRCHVNNFEQIIKLSENLKDKNNKFEGISQVEPWETIGWEQDQIEVPPVQFFRLNPS